MGIRIIVDSTTDISTDVAQRVGIVPLTVRFGEKEYVDKVELDHVKFYEMLIESDVMPSTSQASISDFEDVFEREVNEGNDLIVITLSSKLSGTYYSATVAAQSYEGHVFVVDSMSVSVGAGVLAEFAQQLVDEGMLTAEQIARRIAAERDNVKVVAMFDTLEYLKRGGRISAAAAVAGSLLSIKPVISLRDGEIVILGKARGSRQSNNFLIREIESSGGINFDRPLLLGYTGFDDVVLQKYIKDSARLWEGHADKLKIAPVGSVVGTHAGPGAIAVAFFKNC